ncbi:hypothetical protein NVP1121O_121 [Vibrio phage 1.121.O._10N.286.46.C4]|nr:hypothetical protein NVP1121O_121 [Vibrio phage 1.121.O._10N.286.46.C4]
MANIELRDKEGVKLFPVTVLQNFTFPCNKADKKPFTLRLGVSVVSGYTYHCISTCEKDEKTVPNGVTTYRETTTWKPYSDSMIRNLVPDDIDGMDRQDSKLYRQLLRQFKETN